MIVIDKNQVYSTTDKFVHRIGTENYFKKGTVLKSDSVDSFEEVEEIPEVDEISYEQQVQNKIHEVYSLDDEIAIVRKEIAKMSNTSEEFNKYNQYAEACKKEVKENIFPQKKKDSCVRLRHSRPHLSRH